MEYKSLKSILTNPASNIWVNGKKIANVGAKHNLEIWEYTAEIPGAGKLIVQGVDTNNPQLRVAEKVVLLNGAKLELSDAEYLDLFGQLGYLYHVVQPAKLKQNTAAR